jgi:hypothetical protein
MMKKLFLIALLFVMAAPLKAQFPQFSLGNDLGIQRSLKKEQQYWAFGHTLHFLFNLNAKEGPYIWLSYYTEGKFHNNVVATAKLSTTGGPREIAYTNNAAMRFKQVSMGWKKYFKGSFNIEDGWSIYGYAGFGLLFGRVRNNHSTFIDTSLYDVPVRAGTGNFKRLTLDVGGGWERPVGADIFLYIEGRAWIPTTDYPSKYIFVNNDAPLVGMLNVGIRVLFN